MRARNDPAQADRHRVEHQQADAESLELTQPRLRALQVRRVAAVENVHQDQRQRVMRFGVQVSELQPALGDIAVSERVRDRVEHRTHERQQREGSDLGRHCVPGHSSW